MLMQESSNYFIEINILKGLAILFVIWGHSPQMCGEVNSLIYYTIITPQMVMFFVASGFLFSTKDTWQTFFSKKVMRLMVPYISFWMLLVFIHAVFASYTATGGYSLDYILTGLLTGKHYWFLWVLLWIMITVRLFCFRFGMVFLIVCSVITAFVFRDASLNLWRYFFYLLPFILGIYVRRIYPHVRDVIINHRCLLFCLSISIFYLIYFINSHYIDMDMYIGRFSGAIFFACLSVVLAIEFPQSMFVKFLSHFGKYSLQYYLIHILIMTVVCNVVNRFLGGILCPDVQWFLNFILATLLSYIGLRIMMLTKFTRLICGLK